MKKTIIILLSIVLVAAFGSLVYYSLRHSRGIPTEIEKPEKIILEVPFIDKDIDLSKGISPQIWEGIKPKEVKLMYQLMVLPWPKAVVPSISVKAFHNQKNIYFYISWLDDTQDIELAMNKFSDACAVLFPLGSEVQPPTIMMGFLGKSNIWQWKASQDKEFWQGVHPTTNAYVDFHYPFEEEETFPVSKTVPTSAANDLVAIRVGTVTAKDTQNIEGRGYWDKGTWNVVFKRAFKVDDPELDAVFNVGVKRLCAFAVWNGSKGDRGGRKSISDWVELVVR